MISDCLISSHTSVENSVRLQGPSLLSIFFEDDLYVKVLYINNLYIIIQEMTSL